MSATKTRPSLRARLAVAALAIALGSIGVIYGDLLVAAVTPSPVRDPEQSIARGHDLWAANCEICHGAHGKGDGPAAAGLPKKPKDLTHIAEPPVFPDGVVAYRIANGKGLMPAWKSVLTPQQIWDLVSYIRSQHEPHKG